MMPQEVTIALQKLRDGLPEDEWVCGHIERTVANFLPPEGEPLVEQIQAAVAYVNWALRYPYEVEEDDKPLRNCTCSDVGWVPHDGTDTWRPCLRCNAEMYDRFESISGGEDGEPADL